MSRSPPCVVVLVLTFLSVFLHLTSAFPTLTRRQQDNVFDISKYTVPLSNGPSALPSPLSTLSLKAITLARGTQNYTCPAPSSTTPGTPCPTPTAAGAVATLYDASPLLSLIATRSPGHEQTILNYLSRYLYYFPFPSIISRSHHNDNVKRGDGGFNVPVLGTHYFDASKIPTWDLGPSLGIMKAKRVNGIPAPLEGAIDWLLLESVAGTVGGLKLVYRVETVGGIAGKDCAGVMGGVQVPYSAQYWFYG